MNKLKMEDPHAFIAERQKLIAARDVEADRAAQNVIASAFGLAIVSMGGPLIYMILAPVYFR